MKRETARVRMTNALNAARFITIAELAEKAGASYACANRFLWQLKREGAVREISKADGRRAGFAVYAVTRELENPPSKSTARERLWRAMRIQRRFTIEEVRITAGAAKNNALKYVTGLARGLSAGGSAAPERQGNGRLSAFPKIEPPPAVPEPNRRMVVQE